jgi:hypothetical protein
VLNLTNLTYVFFIYIYIQYLQNRDSVAKRCITVDVGSVLGRHLFRLRNRTSAKVRHSDE